MVSSEGINVDNCNRQHLVYEVLSDILDEGADDAYAQTLFLFESNDWYWNLLQQFDYFNNTSKFK